MKMCNALFCVLVVIFVLCGSVGCKEATFADAYTSAKAMCTMEASTGRVLYGKNQNIKLPMASTTKIMTAITAIENCKDLDEKFTISPKAVGVSGTSIYLREGEAMSVRDLLYGLMLVSGNDASVAIGERVGGGIANFVRLMNDTAAKIGAVDSHFMNTHGLDQKGHYTTAYDLALISSYALSNSTFSEIVGTRNIKITNTDGKTRYLKNKNRLLNSLNGCNGVKTGFTDDAGRCLVSSCKRDGMQVVSVVLNCGPMFEECTNLLEQAFQEYKLVDLTARYDYNKFVQVDGGRAEFVEVGTKGSFCYPLKEEELGNIAYIYKSPKTLVCPIKNGQEVGEIQIYFGNNLLFSEKLYTMEEVRSNNIFEKIKDILRKW